MFACFFQHSWRRSTYTLELLVGHVNECKKFLPLELMTSSVEVTLGQWKLIFTCSSIIRVWFAQDGGFSHSVQNITRRMFTHQCWPLHVVLNGRKIAGDTSTIPLYCGRRGKRCNVRHVTELLRTVQFLQTCENANTLRCTYLRSRAALWRARRPEEMCFILGVSFLAGQRWDLKTQ